MLNELNTLGKTSQLQENGMDVGLCSRNHTYNIGFRMEGVKVSLESVRLKVTYYNFLNMH